MLEAIDGIAAHTAGKSLAEFEQDWLLRLATQRALEIISEASRHIPEDLLSRAPDVPWKQIRGIGNILRHEYHRIADEVVWTVITENLAPLRAAIEVIQQTVGDE
ncbi:HepT-like ribonuclease domain-containing protein [Rhizobium sp. RU36D]|uniref:HepT-like ribonuclease domain-containing protein n=1 Tax=Rhizobium sp. RU36D TaxID=1907415 RepID=UPI001FCD2528|nr:HepT-like ribonuclease domain-containing protein [Rhizobium sp. RU36D]